MSVNQGLYHQLFWSKFGNSQFSTGRLSITSTNGYRDRFLYVVNTSFSLQSITKGAAHAALAAAISAHTQ